jgi:phage recombination protein Bet
MKSRTTTEYFENQHTKNHKMNTENAITVPTDEKSTVEIVPFGTDERIRLSIKMVRDLIAQPTRSGKLPDDRQCIKFIMLCKARHLNPYEGDSFLLGYDTQSGPQFSLITAHQVFLKRAEASQGFNGMQSGVIIKTEDGQVTEREGDIVFEGEKLLGGWAKVFRKDREIPFYRRLKLETFSTGQSRWAKDGAGMIVKCAEADSLRSAFPTHLGGLYVAEEAPPIDVTAAQVPIPRPQIGNGKATAVVAEAEPEPQPEKPTKRPRRPRETAPAKAETPAASPPPPETNAQKIAARLELTGKHKVTDLLKLARKMEWVDEPTSPEGLTLENVGEDKLAIWLEDWTTVVELLDAQK